MPSPITPSLTLAAAAYAPQFGVLLKKVGVPPVAEESPAQAGFEKFQQVFADYSLKSTVLAPGLLPNEPAVGLGALKNEWDKLLLAMEQSAVNVKAEIGAAHFKDNEAHAAQEEEYLGAKKGLLRVMERGVLLLLNQESQQYRAQLIDYVQARFDAMAAQRTYVLTNESQALLNDLRQGKWLSESIQQRGISFNMSETWRRFGVNPPGT